MRKYDYYEFGTIQYKNRKKRIARTVLCAFALVLLVAALALALYSASPNFKTAPESLKLDLPGDTVQLKMSDKTALLAVSDGDYSAFTGLDINALVTRSSYLSDYDVHVSDNSVAKVIQGKVYGLKPGVTVITVVCTSDKSVRASFNLEILDGNGGLYYNITFEYPEKDDLVIKILSGSNLTDMGYSVPMLPSKAGFIATEWTLNGQTFFPKTTINKDITVKAAYSPTDITFVNTKKLPDARYMTEYSADLKSFITSDKAGLEFSSNNLPSGLTLTKQGILSGYPYNVNPDGINVPFEFKVTVTNTINGNSAAPALTLIVEPYEIDLSFSDYNKIYNGAEQTVTVTITNLFAADIGKVFAVADYGGGAAGAKNVNIYTAVVTGLSGERAHCYKLPSDKSFSCSMKISPIIAEIEFYSDNTDETDFNLIYNAKVQGLQARVTSLADGDQCEVFLGYEDDDRAGIRTGINVNVISISNPNYILTDDFTAIFNIIPAPLRVELQSAERIYGAPDPIFGISVMLGVQTNEEGVSDEYRLINIFAECFDAYDLYKPAGIYNLNMNPSKSADALLDNYAITVVSSTFRILRRALVPAFNYTVEKQYDGTVNASAAILNAVYLLSFSEQNYTGKLFGDDVYISGGTFADANAAQSVKLNITLGGDSAANYVIAGEYYGKITQYVINEIYGLSTDGITVDYSAAYITVPTGTVDVSDMITEIIFQKDATEITILEVRFSAEYARNYYAAPGQTVPITV